jgi:hypothetical protein
MYGEFWESSNLGIHVTRIISDSREMFESKAELFQQHWQHFRLWRPVSPRKRPVAASILAIKQSFVYCCASFGRESMVYVGIHVKRIVSDLRETLEIHAELYPVTWAAFHGLEKAIA